MKLTIIFFLISISIYSQATVQIDSTANGNRLEITISYDTGDAIEITKTNGRINRDAALEWLIGQKEILKASLIDTTEVEIDEDVTSDSLALEQVDRRIADILVILKDRQDYRRTLLEEQRLKREQKRVVRRKLRAINEAIVKIK